ncbi:MAG TPA: hypothetical protein PKD75_00565 [Tepidiformaceae bacterium]|nr:hypothetical protein [Tepidiformaceae bacterium]
MAALGLGAWVTMRPEQPWILWLTAALIALATDGLVRRHPRWAGHGFFSSIVYTFLPALGVLGAGLFIDHAVDGYARPLIAAAAALLVGAVAFGEYETVDFGSRLYGTFRLMMAIATYLVAFSFFTVIYTRDYELPVAAVMVGFVAGLLAMELLRESRLAGPSSLLVGIAIGISLAELRIALYFFPLDGLLAGALLIIAFYLATGLVHHMLDHDLEWGTTAEYVLVTAVATAAVVFTRSFV